MILAPESRHPADRHAFGSERTPARRCFNRQKASRCQPPIWNLGLGEIAKCVSTVIVNLQWFFFAALCCLCVPRIGLHFLDRVLRSLTAKACHALIQHHGNDANTFVYIRSQQLRDSRWGRLAPVPSQRKHWALENIDG